ncbi:MAG TPA: peptidoglycan-binding protein LysM [Bacteroidetes bacterium]|nr:peptidoglycan-binding protein LysM [Bacteroidota bacterium]
MGLFSFLKTAGAALAGAHAKKSNDAPAPTISADDTSLAMEKLENAQMAMRITNQIASLGLRVNDLSVEVDDDKAIVYGTVGSQADREKVILAAGNVYGIATVDDRLSVENPEPEAVFYTVKKGDSLSKIAKQFYGSYNKYMKIFEANQPLLKDPDKIYPGQVLRIPSDD